MLEDDPGWPSLRSSVAGFFLPWRRSAPGTTRDGRPDGLVVMRQLFLSFCIAIVAFGVVLAFMDADAGSGRNRSVMPAVVLLMAGAGAGVLGRLFEPSLDCTDDVTLASSYRTRFFVRLASSEVAALAGFVGYFLTYRWWTYPVGLAITAVGFRRAAPTTAHLAEDQAALATQGCPRSLVQAIRSTHPNLELPDR